MISENEVRKVYGDSTGQIIRKGDAGWKSDHPERKGEAYGVNPLSTMEAKMAQRRSRAIVPDVDPNGLDAGEKTVTGDGRDAYHWVVVAEADRA